MSKKLVVERVAYTVFATDGGRLLKTWARCGNELKAVTATTEERLRKKLRRISVDLLNGDVAAAGLETSDHRCYLAAREILAPCNITVDLAAREYAAAREALGPGMSIDQAAREYAAARTELGGIALGDAVAFFRRHSGHVARKTVGEVIEEFMTTLARRSPTYRDVMLYDLGRLNTAHGTRQIGEVTAAELRALVDTTGRMVRGEFRAAGEWRRKQMRSELITLWNFARKSKFLPDLPTAAAALPMEETVSEARDVWDPEHLRRALETVSAHEPAWLPWLVLSAFANVRSVAIRRLDWSHVHWHDALIELPARSSKIKKRVTLKISPVAMSWLDPLRGTKGPMSPEKNHGAFTARLRSKYDLPYYQNILRRSFVTYLLAQSDDEDMVARVANTSVGKLRENYRQIRTYAGRLVTQELAAGWFGAARIIASNVVQLELGG